MKRWDLIAFASILMCIGLVVVGLYVHDPLFQIMGGVMLVIVIFWRFEPHNRLPLLVRHAQDRAAREWHPVQEMADRLGLDYRMRDRRPFRPDVNGVLNGYSISFTTYPGQDRGITLITLKLNKPSNAEVWFTRRLTRDDRLEKRFSIRSTPPAVAEWLLASERVRMGLMRIPPTPAELSVREKSLVYAQTGYERDAEYLESLMQFMGDLAVMLEARPAV